MAPEEKHTMDFKSWRLEAKRKLLEIVRDLSPGRPIECSSDEVAINMQEAGYRNASTRGVASRLGLMKKEGLVKSRLVGQRHLWSPTQEGLRWIKAHRARRTRV